MFLFSEWALFTLILENYKAPTITTSVSQNIYICMCVRTKSIRSGKLVIIGNVWVLLRQTLDQNDLFLYFSLSLSFLCALWLQIKNGWSRIEQTHWITDRIEWTRRRVATKVREIRTKSIHIIATLNSIRLVIVCMAHTLMKNHSGTTHIHTHLNIYIYIC